MNTAAKACIKRDEFDKGMRDTAALIREGMIAPSEAGLIVEGMALEWIYDDAEWVVNHHVNGEVVDTVTCRNVYEALSERDKLRGKVELPEWYTVSKVERG